MERLRQGRYLVLVRRKGQPVEKRRARTYGQCGLLVQDIIETAASAGDGLSLVVYIGGQQLPGKAVTKLWGVPTRLRARRARVV